MFAPKDPVKLTARFAATLNKAKGGRNDWHMRRGVVVYCAKDDIIVIKWHGRKTHDRLPAAAIELVQPERKTQDA
jgi:hypothetical protein